MHTSLELKGYFEENMVLNLPIFGLFASILYLARCPVDAATSNRDPSFDVSLQLCFANFMLWIPMSMVSHLLIKARQHYNPEFFKGALQESYFQNCWAAFKGNLQPVVEFGLTIPWSSYGATKLLAPDFKREDEAEKSGIIFASLAASYLLIRPFLTALKAKKVGSDVLSYKQKLPIEAGSNLKLFTQTLVLLGFMFLSNEFVMPQILKDSTINDNADLKFVLSVVLPMIPFLFMRAFLQVGGDRLIEKLGWVEKDYYARVAGDEETGSPAAAPAVAPGSPRKQ